MKIEKEMKNDCSVQNFEGKDSQTALTVAGLVTFDTQKLCKITGRSMSYHHANHTSWCLSTDDEWFLSFPKTKCAFSRKAFKKNSLTKQ